MPCMADRRGASDARSGPSTENGEDWQAVARAVNDRMKARRISQQELADLADISVSTLRLVQRAANPGTRNTTLSAIARALGWPEDHLLQVLTAGRPATRAQAEGDRPQVAVLQILDGVQEIRDELRRIAHRLDEMDRRR